jgi:hypothetical protein
MLCFCFRYYVGQGLLISGVCVLLITDIEVLLKK